jgi:hypothetical protein
MMGQPVGHRADHHPLDNSGPSAANNEEVSTLAFAESEDGGSGITQFLERCVFDIVQVDAFLNLGKDALLACDQSLRQGGRGGRLSGYSPPTFRGPHHRNQDQAGVMGAGERRRQGGGTVALFGTVNSSDDDRRGPIQTGSLGPSIDG